MGLLGTMYVKQGRREEGTWSASPTAASLSPGAMATLLLWWLQMLQPSSSTCPILAPCPCQEGTCSGDEGDHPFPILAGRQLSCCPWHVLYWLPSMLPVAVTVPSAPRASRQRSHLLGGTLVGL